MTLRDLQQQQQPTADDVSDAGSPEETGSGSAQDQPGYQRVTPEEAASLPYDELKKRMREEARLHEEGLLPASASTEPAEENDDEADTSNNAGPDTSSSSASGQQ